MGRVARPSMGSAGGARVANVTPPARSSSSPVAKAHSGMGRQCREQLLHRNEDFGRLEHRTLAIVAPVLVPLAGVRPESTGRVVDVFGEDDDRIGREIVRQRGGLLEEQRQVVLDARRPSALGDLAVHGASRRIALEPPPPRAPEPRHRAGGGRELARGEQIDTVHSVRRALAVGVEDPEALDLVVEQVDAQRPGGTHRVQIEQRAAHRVLAVLHHLADARITSLVQTLAERVDVQAIASRDPESMAVDEAAGSDPAHRGGHRGHQHPGFQGRQLRKGLQAFRHDVLVRGEEVVGQRLPVRESQDSGAAVQIELQLGLETMRGLVVRRDHEHRRIGLLHETREGKAAGAAVQR